MKMGKLSTKGLKMTPLNQLDFADIRFGAIRDDSTKESDWTLNFSGQMPNEDQVDLRPTDDVPNTENQLRTGTCTFNAFSSAIEFLMRKGDLKPNGIKSDVSRLGLYWFARFIDAGGDESKIRDGGATLRAGCEAASNFGFCA